MFAVFALIAATQPGPANLVITHVGQQPTVVRYKSMEQCERAKRSLLEQAKEQGENQGSVGDRVILRRVSAYCIPA